MGGLKASIVIVGSEILKGIIQDTNSHWLAKRITELGYNVIRIMVVPDNYEGISWALRSALEVSDAIIVCGGLGFTEDDVTLDVSARVLGLKLALNDEALGMIKAKLGDKITYQIKAAYLPEGSKPLRNSVGISPGIYLRVDGRDIFFLPGVPAEMKSIFESEVSPILSQKSKFLAATINVITDHKRESEVDSLISHLKRKYPGAYFKTHASTPVRLSVVLSAPTQEELNSMIDLLVDELKRVLSVKSVEVVH